jgi:hypothetical protein
MKTRRSLLKSALAFSAISCAATTKSQAISATIQPIRLTALLSLPFSEAAVRGKTIRFFAHMTVDGQSAPPGLCISILRRIGSPTAAPCTIAIRPTDCAGWVEFDYFIPTDLTIKNIWLSAYYGGPAHAPSASLLQQVPLEVYGRKPV